jgi:predicted metalloprotease with PDZ domain
MKKTFLSLLVLVSALVSGQQINRFSVDLRNLDKGRLHVEAVLPAYGRDTLVYQIAAVVPGSYMVKNYASFVTAFNAYDQNGKKLRVKYDAQENSFTIYRSSLLARIVYDVNETWTAPKDSKYVFQPGGSHFEQDNYYCINAFALFGYFDGYTRTPYEITFTKNPALYCSTGAAVNRLSSDKDVITASGFDELQDNPLMFSIPDTISLQVKNCRFHVSVFSRNHKITASYVLSEIEPVLTKSLASFFPAFPVSDYHFLFFFPGYQDDAIKGEGFGGMEHGRSSFYFLPEDAGKSALHTYLRHTVAHEFLHVLTPLSLKSEQVAHFNYRHPDGSEHLWMYEGAVEYLSQLILLQGGLISEGDFWEDMRDKLTHNDRFSTISMTELGKKVFENSDMNYYLNVYNRGALLCFLLDIRINELTGGKMNLSKLLFQLDDKYKGKWFEDNKLFDEMAAAVHPDLKDFLVKYVEGKRALPIGNYLSKIGYDFQAEKADSIYTFGRIRASFSPSKNRCEVTDASPRYNLFGIITGDVIVRIDDTVPDDSNTNDLVNSLNFPENNRPVKFTYIHNGEERTVAYQPVKVPVTQLNWIGSFKSLQESQRMLRKQVLNM